jgi:AcrR family transcriptional regulator
MSPAAPPSPAHEVGEHRARASALPRSERRTAIVEATLPLLLTHGAGVTTRQIAEAAGVAEGTIFRAFTDKDELIRAVADRVFDPTPTQVAVQAIDLDLPLEERLATAVEILQRRVTVIWQFMTAAGLTKPPERDHAARGADAPEMQALARIFEPDRDRLRRSPDQSAQVLRSLTFACSHPAFTTEQPLPPEEIVSLLLDGIRDGRR